ncbi:glycoside hydrolase family 24 protein [Dictyostelium discoideum AX4]|uniref:Probable T4-type lysozyme 2 n=1 Tax=Dictyostelium discoideum TaxID=44689 RepID=LYST2_DICDI|nr:glycoside hydrolase family 24 protein [Dictyostelium discoideum AX4]Q86AA1.1 RecName: Full=Probable T4-type lysozyme 2; AltName: Full=Muramidase [Dictyostelium discoideum]EAL70038.1 glycoside hydrolase family 24 protein [Dictyostelium discoideum AX4]|eukprot:XP_643994.1 glycoside hydrolase family 24 protein [Dictyostelium discoideum AX4]
MVSSLKDMLKYDEGEKLEMYKDTEGNYTIGIGHLITKNKDKNEAIKILEGEIGHTVKLNSKKEPEISSSESESLFEKDKSVAINSIENSSTLSTIYNNLDSNRKMALANMVFQMGASNVSKFKKSLKLIEEKKWAEAAIELKNSTWNTQTPKRSNRVISVFETGTLKEYK